MHTVAILAYDGVVASDLSIPADIFSFMHLPNGRPGYRVKVCGYRSSVQTGLFTIKTEYDLRDSLQADTLVLPGIRNIDQDIQTKLKRTICEAAEAGIRIASVCTGAFVLAATGLLDGLRATTHWAVADILAHKYPQIDVDPKVLYVDNGQFLTSAGAAASLDLSLHLVRQDYGSEVAAATARAAVMPLERHGGQAQYITHAPPSPDGVSLEPLLRWLEKNLEQQLTLDAIARQSALSVRTLNRRFHEQIGTTPLQWLLKARVRRAQHLLETTKHSIDAVAEKSGFGSPTSLRTQFNKVVGTNPQAYRRSFQSSIA